MDANYLQTHITGKIIRAFYNVYNTLGYGFLEKLYQNALVIELKKLGLKCVPNLPIEVFYGIERIGFYRADILVEDCVIVENKTSESLCAAHEAQLLNYLRATKIEVGILLNFGKEPEFKRKVYSKHLKN